ncbi:putative metal-binding motif-containing protein, partial [Myxococcota bacterium]|nr:putative metal-binding motif-containing protein [Myxococcota bacterium]
MDGHAACDDCDNRSPLRYPGAFEACDGIDNDCDEEVDGDVDFDGFDACEDCRPLDPYAWPGAPETCDGVDNDCDGLLDEDDPDFATDADGDGVLSRGCGGDD